MTSEVVLMNRRAVALAADSATTVTRWAKGERRKRYFKGTNKLFHLANMSPVGLMINGAGSMQGVPWDVLTKSFRDSLGSSSFDTLSEYGNALFCWLENNSDAYPSNFISDQFLSEVVESAGRVSLPPLRNVRGQPDKKKRHQVLEENFFEQSGQIAQAPFVGNSDEEDLRKALDLHKNTATQLLRQDPFLAGICQVVGAENLAETAISAVFKKDHSTLDDTGVVVAGYGEREYFPSVDAYKCYGNVLGKLIIEKDEDSCIQINQMNQSEILPFAKSDMIYTFMYGVSIAGLVEIDKLNLTALDAIESRLKEGGLLDQSADINEIKDGVHEEFKENTANYIRTNHAGTLREVVGMLPIEELADLAETLVQIESLKERVTTDEESVSGPIDVALISKNDGFVWIKRKHYFKPDLNPRFFERLRNRMGSSDD